MSNKMKWAFFLLMMLFLIVIGNAIYQLFFVGASIYIFAMLWGVFLGVFVAGPFLRRLGLRPKD